MNENKPMNVLYPYGDERAYPTRIHDLNQDLHNPSPRDTWTNGDTCWYYNRHDKKIHFGVVTDTYKDLKLLYVKDLAAESQPLCMDPTEAFETKEQLIDAIFGPAPDVKTALNHTTYRQLSNYVANELGVNRTVILEMLATKIEQRNVDQLIKESVEAYFQVGHAAINPALPTIIENVIRKRTDQLVHDAITREVQDIINQIVKNRVTEIFDACQLSSVNHDAHDENNKSQEVTPT